MAGDYSLELPAWGDTDYGGLGSSWQEPSKDSWVSSSSWEKPDYGGLGSDWEDLGKESWFTDSSNGGKDSSALSWLGDAAGGVWDWLKSPQGTNVAFGTIKGLLDMWKTDLASRMKGNPSGGGGGGGGSNAAELYDARVKMHNASINKPMDMGLVRFQK